MKCPYCAEEIKDDAVVCKHCHRDFFIILPLLKTLNDMGKRIETLEAEIAHPTVLAAPAATLAKKPAVTGHGLPALSPISASALCIITLVVAHFFIIVQYDLRLAYLRIALFLLPFLFGLAFRESGERELLWDFGAGLAVAIVSTFAMLVVVAKTDRVPIMPEGFGEWRELSYYVASITFGFFAGSLLRQIVAAAKSPVPPRNKIVARTSRFLATNIASGDETVMEKNIKRIQTAISASVAFGSAVISVISGLGITGGSH